jgi:hypothetical protein
MTTNDQPLPTHRCTECGALWRLWDERDTGHEGHWNLRSPKAGPCCDMAPMGEQIVPLTWGDLRTALAGPVDPNHDIVPTLRQFDGLLMGKAADEIERLRTALAAAPAAAQALSVLQYNAIPALQAIPPSLFESVVRGVERAFCAKNGITLAGVAGATGEQQQAGEQQP